MEVPALGVEETCIHDLAVGGVKVGDVVGDQALRIGRIMGGNIGESYNSSRWVHVHGILVDLQWGIPEGSGAGLCRPI